jgi:glycosyltransferase involved in cell wall biosynthesis
MTVFERETPFRKKLGIKARQRVVKYYNQDTMFSEYSKLYNAFQKSIDNITENLKV